MVEEIVWEIIYDWRDVCHTCGLEAFWSARLFLLVFIIVGAHVVFKTRQLAIDEGRAKDYNFASTLKIPYINKRLKFRFNVLSPFILVGIYWIAGGIIYTYQVLMGQYIDHDYNRLKARIEEGPVYCIEGEHIESYRLKTGNLGMFFKFSGNQIFYRGNYDNNFYCYGKSKMFHSEFYDIKSKYKTDYIEFKMCWVKDVDDRKSYYSKEGGKCIFELKYRLKNNNNNQ